MASIGQATRKSVMALVKEVTEGVPVAPSASTDYLRLQDGFSMTPAFEELENDELTGSIGQSKSALGFENPEASASHYVRHSGTEAVSPDYGLILEAALGEEVAATTERDVVSATTSAVTLDVGEGAEYERGKAFLVKDATNGYSIRNIDSVAGDVATLGQNLAVAPLAGINLGRAILYKPLDDCHPTLTAWLYRANGGAVEAMAGSRVTDMTVNIEAGQFINMDYTLAGIEYFFNPIEATATSKYVDFTSDDGTFAVQLTEQLYKDPHELAASLQALMDAATAETITVTYSDSDGKYTIANTTGATLELLWSTGANAANSVGAALGFDVAADDTAALSYEGDNAVSLAAPQTPAYDSAGPLVAKSNEILLGDADDLVCFPAQTVTFTVTDTKADIPDVCAESGRSGSIINEREVTIDIVALLSQYDADKFRRFRANENVKFTYNAGEKSGGNWVAGKAVNFYVPTATITSHELGDVDGLVTLNLSLSAYVADGVGEVYVNLL